MDILQAAADTAAMLAAAAMLTTWVVIALLIGWNAFLAFVFVCACATGEFTQSETTS